MLEVQPLPWVDEDHEIEVVDVALLRVHDLADEILQLCREGLASLLDNMEEIEEEPEESLF